MKRQCDHICQPTDHNVIVLQNNGLSSLHNVIIHVNQLIERDKLFEELIFTS